MADTARGSLVGRDTDLEILGQLVTGVLGGQGSNVLVTGEAGIGKTSLVRWVGEAVRAGGGKVFAGAAHPFERARPFGPLTDALDIRRRSTDPRRAAIASLLSGDDGSRSRVTGPVVDVRYRVIDDIVDLLEAESTDGPVLLAVEDLHWADSSTLAALRSVLQRLRCEPLLFVGTLRPAPRSGELDQLVEEARAEGGHLLHLGSLSGPEVHAVARQQLGREPEPALAAELSKAGGNPLWVVEMVRALGPSAGLTADVSPSGPDGTPELPNTLRELVVRRLRYLPDSTLSMLQLAAVIGDTATVADLVRVTGHPATDVIADLDDAFRAGLLDERGDTVVFRHQLVHDAIYQQLPRAARQAMHREVAGALAASGADLLQVADHLVLGALRGDLEAVGWLRQAASNAAATGPAVSARLLMRAEALLPGQHEDADLLALEIVEALLRAGEVSTAIARAEAVLDRRHREEVDVPLRLAIVEALSMRNQPQELIERAEQTLAEVPDLSLADQALVHVQASYGRTFGGDLVGGEREACRALELAEQAADDSMRVWSLVGQWAAVGFQGRYGEALVLTERALAIAGASAQPEARLRHPRFFHGMALLDVDRFDEATAAFDAALDEYAELGSTWSLPDTLLMAATCRFLTGEWTDAVPGLEAGLRAAEEQGQAILVARSAATLALIDVASGDPDGARRRIAPYIAGVAGGAAPMGYDVVAYVEAIAAEADGDLLSAFERLRRTWERDVRSHQRHFHRLLAPALVRLALELGETTVAHDVADVTQQGAALAPEVATVQAAALRCRGLAEGHPDLLVEAVEVARRGPRLLDLAGACEDAAPVLAGAGRVDEAKAVLAEALDLYDTAGATAWAARVSAGLRQLGVRRGVRGERQRPTEGWESLTPTELSVSHSVAEGLTNRDVARRLHMSPHTVNTHLRHVYRKLGIANRTGLAAVVARHSSESEPARATLTRSSDVLRASGGSRSGPASTSERT